MSNNEATFPLSPPSWTWDPAPAASPDALDDAAPKAKSRSHGVPFLTELPSRRWLVQASRS